MNFSFCFITIYAYFYRFLKKNYFFCYNYAMYLKRHKMNLKNNHLSKQDQENLKETIALLDSGKMKTYTFDELKTKNDAFLQSLADRDNQKASGQ